MPVQYAIKLDKRQLRKLSATAARQVPFATSLALNKTAHSVRKNTVERVYPQSFDVKNKSFARAAFRVQNSNKRNLRARVFDRLGRPWLETQIRGGQKRPISSSRLAVPINVRRLASGRISKRNQARNLPRSFVRDFGRGRGPAVWQRVGRGKRQRLRLAYELEPSVRIRPAFPFYREAERVTQAQFPRQFDAAMRRALATAR